MMDPAAASDLSPRQQQLAAASAGAALAARAALARQGQPAPGDRYVLAATADFPVEWVLLERHRQLPAFLAVLADIHPMTGSADFALPGSALRLRAEALGWIEESALDPALRAGALDSVTLERARRKLLAGGQNTDPESLSEVDASLEYRDWRREVVAPALAALGPQARFLTPAERSLGEVVERNRSPRRLAAAAAVFCALSLGLGGWAGWQRERIGELAAAKQRAEAALERERTERDRLASQANQTGQDWQRRLDATAREEALKRASLERRINELEKRPAFPQILLNVPVALLNPAEQLRGDNSEVVRLDAEAPHLMVVLNLDTDKEYPFYRAVLKRQGSTAPLWQSDRLERQDFRVTFSLEKGRFALGNYRVDLYGLRGGRAEPLGEYELTIAR